MNSGDRAARKRIAVEQLRRLFEMTAAGPERRAVARRVAELLVRGKMAPEERRELALAVGASPEMARAVAQQMGRRERRVFWRQVGNAEPMPDDEPGVALVQGDGTVDPGAPAAPPTVVAGASAKPAVAPTGSPPGAGSAAPATSASEATAVSVSLLIDPSELSPGEINKIAVPKLSGSGADSGVLDALTDVAVAEASRAKGFTIIGSSDLEAMLGFEQQKDLLGCADDVACVAQIGGALGVEGLLAAKVGKIGSTWVLTVTLIDTQHARALTRGSVKTQGEPDALIPLLEALVRASLAKLPG